MLFHKSTKQNWRIDFSLHCKIKQINGFNRKDQKQTHCTNHVGTKLFYFIAEQFVQICSEVILCPRCQA